MLVLDVPENVKVHTFTERFRECRASDFSELFPTVYFFLIHPVYKKWY